VPTTSWYVGKITGGKPTAIIRITLIIAKPQRIHVMNIVGLGVLAPLN
jgi:hypothetical protein